MNNGVIEQVRHPLATSTSTPRRPSSLASSVRPTSSSAMDGVGLFVPSDSPSPRSRTPRPDKNTPPARSRDTVYLGMMTRFIVRLESGEDLVVVRTNDKAREDAQGPATGDHVLVSWHEGDARGDG